MSVWLARIAAVVVALAGLAAAIWKVVQAIEDLARE